MTARKYFDSISRKRRHISSLSTRIQELRYDAMEVGAVRYDKDRVQTSPQNHMEKILIDLLPEIEAQYKDEIEAYHRAWQKAEKELLEMDNPVYAELLQLRYLHDTYRPMRWENIAVKMGYSYDRVRHMHRDALKAFEEQYLKEAA